MNGRVDPKMAAVLDELDAVLRKHECGGVMVIASKERAAWRVSFPEWSSVYQESDNRMRVRLRSKDHNTGEQSLHFLLATRDILNMVSRQFRAMSAGVLAALKEKGINVDHLNQALEDLDA